MFFKVRLFISYSRDKSELASSIRERLIKKGYLVFFDQESVNIGDSFPDRIENSLKNCNGFVMLISNKSIESEWCKFEYYYSFLYRKIIIPLIVEEIDKPTRNPLSYLQKELNYVQLEENSEKAIDNVLLKVEDKLRAVRKSAILDLSRKISVPLSIIALVTFLIVYSVDKINDYNYSLSRKELLTEIKESKSIFTKNEIEAISTKFLNDKELAAQLFIIENDVKASIQSKLNSRILIGFLMSDSPLSERMVVENIDWKNSVVRNNQIVNRYFKNGKIEHVNFDEVSFSNIYFLGKKNNNYGTTFSDLKFNICSFNMVFFDSNLAEIVDFTGCKFYNCHFNITNFFKVNFITIESKDPSIINISGSTYFDHCTFDNDFRPDKKNTIDFTKIKAVRFENINFSNCHFKNGIDEDWFVNCGFYNCTFSSEEVKNNLGKNNKIEL